ncbi:MAG: DUF3795 domain-containing protein [Ardenticatenales bacterium]|nr:DUF3795 domain-containing protein [Ardenticatenales bacterium]
MAAGAQSEMIGACGIDCGDCDIRKVPHDPEAAQRIVAWFRQMEWLEPGEGVKEVLERSMYCKGCREDRSVHWSADCWILRCCVDDKGLEFCYQCDGFPCERLSDRANESTRYDQALNRLQRMGEALE